MKIINLVMNLLLMFWLAAVSYFLVSAQSDNENRFRVIAEMLYGESTIK